MEAARTEWTDKRLDDLKSSMDDGFRRMDERFVQIDSKFDGLQRSMVTALVAVCTMMFAGFGALITLFAMHF
jgi:hypothetical protein